MMRLFVWLVVGTVSSGSNEEAYTRARKDGLWDEDCERVSKQVVKKRDRVVLKDDVERFGRGVVMSAAGDAEFMKREVKPAAQWLESLRSGVKVALFAEQGLVDKDLRSAFDVVIEEPSTGETPLGFRVKAFKIRAMARSPFEETMYLDFDARPCRPDFFDVLWKTMQYNDIALADNFRGQDLLSRNEDLRREHASGCVLLKSSSKETQQLLRDYALAHKLLKGTRRGRRDQPALMVALRVNKVKMGTISNSEYCRKNTSETVSCDTCVVAHKPAKYDAGHKIFVVGFKKTGTTTLAAALKTLKIGPEPDHAGTVAATLALLESNNARPAVTLAAKFRAFADAPWCMAGRPGDFLTNLATVYPRSKFILTVRDPLDWWESTRNWLLCLKPFNIHRYILMLGATNFSKPAFLHAFHLYNDRVQDYFRETNRLLVIDLAKHPSFPWTDLCTFVEAWGRCPTNEDLPTSLDDGPSLRRNAFLENDFLRKHPDAAPSADELAQCRAALASSFDNDDVLPTPDALKHNSALARLRHRRGDYHRRHRGRQASSS